MDNAATNGKRPRRPFIGPSLRAAGEAIPWGDTGKNGEIASALRFLAMTAEGDFLTNNTSYLVAAKQLALTYPSR